MWLQTIFITISLLVLTPSFLLGLGVATVLHHVVPKVIERREEMIGRFCAEVVIFVLWSVSGLLMWQAWGEDWPFALRCLCIGMALVLFIAGFKILRKELQT